MTDFIFAYDRFYFNKLCFFANFILSQLIIFLFDNYYLTYTVTHILYVWQLMSS